MPKRDGASVPVFGSVFQRGGVPRSTPSSANTSSLPATIRSAAAKYGAGEIVAEAWIHGLPVRRRSGAGVSVAATSQRSVCFLNVWTTRNGTSAIVMHRKRFRYQRARDSGRMAYDGVDIRHATRRRPGTPERTE